jgi:hypothetical protein
MGLSWIFFAGLPPPIHLIMAEWIGMRPWALKLQEERRGFNFEQDCSGRGS